MNPTGTSQFDQARIEWAIRLRYSPLPNLEMKWLSANLNAFRIGELRVAGKIWEVMMERDGELALNADKRASDLAGLEWEVVSDGSVDGDRHAEALNYFYKNLRATRALDQDATGGMSELLHQMATAHSYYYSAHEILLRIDNPAAREVTAEFRHTPIWFFESRRGYLAYLKHIFDAYGQPCLQGEWLTCVGMGWMRPLCLAFAMKHFQLRDWLVFCQRYGSGFIEAITDSQKGDTAWEEARETLRAISNDGAVIHSQGVTLKFLDTAAKNSLPFEALVERVDRLYAKCYRGIDLATSSRGTEAGTGRAVVGASVQKEESGIFLTRDAAWATGCLNERVDRAVIRYLFNQEPRAGVVIVAPLDESAAEDLKSVQTLVPMGLRISLAEAYRRFRWKKPAAGEECLSPARKDQPRRENEELRRRGGEPGGNGFRRGPAGNRGRDGDVARKGDWRGGEPERCGPNCQRNDAGPASGCRQLLLQPTMKPNAYNTPVLLENEAATLDEDGWALIAPFGEHPKTRVVKKNGMLTEEKFIQVLDEESAGQLLSRENSLFRRIRRAVVGIPVYKGHPDLGDYAPETAGAPRAKQIIGTIDRVRKSARGIEAHFVLTPAGADAVERAGCKYPSALWMVQPIGKRGDATLARPFKLLSAGLTAHPNIRGVEPLANAVSRLEFDGGGPLSRPGGHPLPTARGEGKTRQGPRGGMTGREQREEEPLSRPDGRPLPAARGEGMTSHSFPAGRGEGINDGREFQSREMTQITEPIQENKPTQEPEMKLIAGWLLARGAALANAESPTETEVLEALQRLHTATAGEVTSLGNEKSTLAGENAELKSQITTLTASRQTLENERSGLAAQMAELKAGRSATVVDLAIARGKLNVAERAGRIEALANAEDFEKEASQLLASATRYRMAGSTEPAKALSNHGADGDPREEYCACVERHMKETGETDPIKAHHAVMQRNPGLAEKLKVRSQS